MRHRLLLLPLVALGVLLGPACGGDGGREPVAVLTSASTKTVDAKTSRVALDVTIDDKTAPGGARKITGEGAFEFTKGHGTLTMDTAGLGLPGMTGKIELVSLGDVLYLQVPSGFGLGKPWLKFDLASLGQSGGFGLAGLQELSSNDPAANLRYVQGATEVEERGEEKVRGVDTTRYHFIVDLEKAKASVPADKRDDIDRLIKLLGRSTYPADAWVDGDDRIRRLRATIPAKGGTGGSIATQEFYDFGVDVEATAPAADQVADFADLLQAAGQAPG